MLENNSSDINQSLDRSAPLTRARSNNTFRPPSLNRLSGHLVTNVKRFAWDGEEAQELTFPNKQTIEKQAQKILQVESSEHESAKNEEKPIKASLFNESSEKNSMSVNQVGLMVISHSELPDLKLAEFYHSASLQSNHTLNIDHDINFAPITSSVGQLSSQVAAPLLKANAPSNVDTPSDRFIIKESQSPGNPKYNFKDTLEVINGTKEGGPVAERVQGDTATAPLIFKVPHDDPSKEPVGIGIFKFASEGQTVSFLRQVQIGFKGSTFGVAIGARRPTELIPGECDDAKAMGEVAAYKGSQKLGWCVIPETKHVVYNEETGKFREFIRGMTLGPMDKLGTLQLFAQGYKEVGKLISEKTGDPSFSSFTSRGLLEYQMCCVLSAQLGLVDGHIGNVMVKMNEKKEVESCLLIDNGHCMIQKFPTEQDISIIDSYLSITRIPILCKHSLLPIMQEEIEKKLTKDNYERIFQELKNEEAGVLMHPKEHIDMSEVYYAPATLRAAQKRNDLIRLYANDIENNAPINLDKYKTEEEIQAKLDNLPDVHKPVPNSWAKSLLAFKSTLTHRPNLRRVPASRNLKPNLRS